MEWIRNPDNFNNIGNDINKAKYYRNNLDIALEEGLKEFKLLAKKYIINNKLWLIHPNVNLYIDTTDCCPCNCGFCIAKTTDGRKGFVNIQHVINNIKLLEKSSVNFTCQITGGEPTLHPELYKIRKICGNRKTVINTNFASKELNVFDHINISCHHYNSIIESEITNYNRDREIFKNNLSGIENKIRLQCNLIGGYIDTFGEIMQYIAWGYHKMNVINFAFSFLTELPSGIMYDKSIIDYVKEKPCVKFNDIMKELEKREHWEFIKYRGGVACYYEVWKYKAYEKIITVVFKYSNNNILHKLDNEDYYVPDLIIHPNGTMTASWDSRIKKI